MPLELFWGMRVGRIINSGLKKKWRRSRHRWPQLKKVSIIPIAVVVVLGVVAILAYKSLSHHNTPADYEKVPFAARKTTSHDLPNTVVFNYNIDELEGDSFFIQQSWDDNRRVRIYKNNYTLTDIYYEPGYHKAKLIVNNQVVKTFDVSIPTNGWFVFVHRPVARSIPVYIRNSPLVNNGMLGITGKDLAAHGIDSLDEHIYCYTYFPGLQKVSSDNFHFKARVRMRNVAKLACPRLMCEIYTQRTFIFFRATSPGCTANTDAIFGEDFLSGQNNDLSGLGCDVTQWQDMEILIKDRRAAVLINGKEVLSHAYKTASGGIAGIGFISNGLVEVDEVHLKVLDGTPVYSSEF